MVKRKRGRQKSDRTEHLEVRLSAKEKESYEKAAAAMGVSLSDWVRLTLTAKTKE